MKKIILILVLIFMGMGKLENKNLVPIKKCEGNICEEYTKNIVTGKIVGEYKLYIDKKLRKLINYNEKGEEVGKQVLYDEKGKILKEIIIDSDGKIKRLFSTTSIFGDVEQTRTRIEGNDEYLVVFKSEKSITPMKYKKVTGDPSDEYKMHGKEINYDPYGFVESEILYKDGEKEGISKYYYAGVLIEEREYKNDEVINSKSFIEGIYDEEIYTDGEHKLYYDDGGLAYEIVVKNENPISVKFYDRDGNLVSKKIVNPNGSIKETRYDKKGNEIIKRRVL